jgi:hypothetical protein
MSRSLRLSYARLSHIIDSTVAKALASLVAIVLTQYMGLQKVMLEGDTR